MNSIIKKVSAVVLVICLAVAVYWTVMMYNYESDSGTKNIFSSTDDQSIVSNNSSDQLFDLTFESGTDDLDWSRTKITLSNEGNEFQCTTGGLISLSEGSGKVKTSLAADGITFNAEIDADSDEFVYLKIGEMEQSNESDYTIRFSKTDIFLSENVVGLYLDEVNFNTLNNSNLEGLNYTESSEERLDWYDYDLSVHRVEAKDRVYVIEDNSTKYKIQVLNYYNSDDEQRQISLVISWIDGEPFQALNDPEKTQPSPCILIDNNPEENLWRSNETISVRENNIDICNSSCELIVKIYYEGVIVEGKTSISIN